MACICLRYLIYKSIALSFAHRKLELNKIYSTYANELPFKYYISISEGSMLILLVGGVQNFLIPACKILAHSLSLISGLSNIKGISKAFHKSQANLIKISSMYQISIRHILSRVALMYI